MPSEACIPCCRIGTAGWAIPASDRERFAAEGSTLERYASTLNAVEINSSFHRPHRPATYRRWAEAVPESFRFSIKLPKAISHERKLVDCGDALDTFFGACGELGRKVAVVLVQLPPKLAFDIGVADAFFRSLAERSDAAIACEPRHASWFERDVNAFLTEHHVARVAADPARHAGAEVPGGWTGLRYWRMHGSPRTYYSRYDDAAIGDLARVMVTAPDDAWCIFDNTAGSCATGNALDLKARVPASTSSA